MTARKVVKSDTRKPAKPKQRKGSKPTLTERVRELERVNDVMILDLAKVPAAIELLGTRLDALESRDRLRDKSSDAPVSNNAEAIGWRAPRDIPKPPRWKFWRRGS